MSSVDFDLRQLEIFCKVVELESFSKAAHAVFLSQASVSERIANLEGSVGTRILDRLGRNIVPTRAGELLYKNAVLLLEMKRTACLEMEAFLGLKQGEIRLGGSTIPGEYILPQIIGRFHRIYPLIAVALSVADTTEIRGRVLEGALELGVIGSKIPHKALIHRELWKDELVVAVPARHRWAKRKTVSPEELVEESFIMRETGSGTLNIMEEHLRASGAIRTDALTVVARFGSSTAVKEGIKAGLGISILSYKALDTELKTGILKVLRIRGLPIYRSFYLIRDKRRIASPICQDLLDFLLTSSKEEEKTK